MDKVSFTLKSDFFEKTKKLRNLATSDEGNQFNGYEARASLSIQGTTRLV